MKDVVCLGLIVSDVIVKPVIKLPQRGKLELVSNIQLHTGGCALNTAFVLSKLGIKTGIIGRIGNDGFGEFILKKLKEMKIDTKNLIIDKINSTSTTAVLVSEDGERSFLHSTGANSNLSEKDIDFKLLSNYKILHIGGTFLMNKLEGKPLGRVLKKAKEMNIITSVDTCWDPEGKWYELIHPLLKFTDIILPSYDEAVMISRKKKPEDIADFFLNRGPKIVIIKMGDRGCFIKNHNQSYTIPALKVKVVDTTGAGDAFVGGFLTGYLKGWGLKQSGIFANAVGALCVSSLGAFSGILSFTETLEFISKNFK